MENTRQTGAAFEEKAARFLEEKGCRVLEQNYRVRSGEIDLIFLEGETVCFAEVKARRTENLGFGAMAVDRKKQIRLCRAADYYMASQELDEAGRFRFDVIDFTGGAIRWIKNAFDYI